MAQKQPKPTKAQIRKICKLATARWDQLSHEARERVLYSCNKERRSLKCPRCSGAMFMPFEEMTERVDPGVVFKVIEVLTDHSHWKDNVAYFEDGEQWKEHHREWWENRR